MPYYKGFKSPTTFLDDIDANLKPFRDRGIAHYYVGLRPTQSGLEKHRNANHPIAIEEIVPYIHEHISTDQYKYYNLRIAEYAVSEFGAVAIINPSGSKQVDIIIGDVEPLATGRQRPQYQARSDPFKGVLHYTEVKPERDGNPPAYTDEDRHLLDHPLITAELRTVIGGFMSKIPRIGGEVHDIRWPGRYEIAIVKRANGFDETGSLVALCLDAQPDLGGTHHPYALPEEPLYYTYGERAN